MSPGVLRWILLSITLTLLLSGALNAKPTKIKDITNSLDSLKAQLDAPRRRTGKTFSNSFQSLSRNVPSSLRRRRNDVDEQSILPKDVNTMKARVLPNETQGGTQTPTEEKSKGNWGVDSSWAKVFSRAGETENSMSDRLSSMKSSIIDKMNTVTTPIDQYTKKAVGGVGLVLGIANGVASGIGTQAYNSIVRVHNTNMDNFQKLRDLTNKVSHSALDLGSTMATETVNMLDAMRRENNRVLKKVTDNIPVVRHLVALKDVAELSATNSLTNLARGTKRLGDFALNAVSMQKAKELEETAGGISGLLSGMSGMANSKNVDSLVASFGQSSSIGGMIKGMVSENEPVDTFDIGNFIGKTSGAAKLAHAVINDNMNEIITG